MCTENHFFIFEYFALARRLLARRLSGGPFCLSKRSVDLSASGGSRYRGHVECEAYSSGAAISPLET
jgi:hypothetical protein